MASVQELIEGLLDDKLTTLVAETKALAEKQVVERYRRLLAVLGLTSLLVLVLIFVVAFKQSYQQTKSIHDGCVARNAKEHSLYVFANDLIQQQLEHPMQGLTKDQQVQQTNLFKNLTAMRDAFATPGDCEAYK